MSTATIIDSFVLIKPSKTLCSSFKKLNPELKIPSRIKYFISNNKNTVGDIESYKDRILLLSCDYEELKTVQNKHKTNVSELDCITNQEIETFSSDDKENGYLRVEDLIWLQQNLNGQNTYIHELLKDSTLFVPENKKIERNPELEKRCAQLKIQQENKIYQSMTKNIDNTRKHQPEDTFGYHIKQFNKQLIAVFQFIVSVATGFAFGFIGIELMVGPLDFGFKLLLGIICSLIIALAELYFLAKQLNEI